MGYARRRRLKRIQESRNNQKPLPQITLKAMQLVEDLRIDLNQLQGTGAGGKITVADVNAYLKERTKGQEEEE